jgi:hypothetical protein
MSKNHFVGAVTDAIFILPSLQTIILSQNCFSGTLPSSICLNHNLENVVLDLLTGNCVGTVGFFQGFVLNQYMIGSIPTCIWNSSWIRTLHLMGNGLTGSVLDLADSSSLSILGLGSNQLTGTIPRTFQHRSFMQLDLSVNRLSGTLESDLYVNRSTAVYDLSVNRLSGNIPSALYGSFSAGIINVLQGNMFGCRQYDIPPSDVSHASYQCGSFDFQYYLVAWCAGVSGAIIVTAVMIWLRVDLANRFINLIRSATFVGILGGPVFCLGISVFGLGGFVSVKLLGYASTHTVQYWWTSTIIFVHDWFISVFLFLLLAASSIVVTLTIMSFASVANIASKPNTAPACVPNANAVFRRLVAHFVNVIVMTAVNAVYILVVVDSINGVFLLALQAALGIFKLVWSTFVIPWLLSWSDSDSNMKIPHWICMVLVVFLAAPFISSFSESSSCFLFVLTRPSLTSFSFVAPTDSFGAECSYLGCAVISTTVYEVIHYSMLPPWIYSYQCSSAVIVSYAPVLISSYLMSGIVAPFTLLIGANFLPPKMFVVINKSLPFLVFKMTYVDNSSAAILLDSCAAARLGRKMVVKYIVNLAVMITFGLAVPLLAIAVICDTIFYSATMIVLLERFVRLCDSNGLDAGKVQLEFWDSFGLEPREVPGCCYIVLGSMSVFWCLFAFDWVGDVYGSLAGGLVMLVPLLMPTMLCFAQLRRKRQREKRTTASKPRNDDIELIVIGNPVNPVILPQNTVDDFDSANN